MTVDNDKALGQMFASLVRTRFHAQGLTVEKDLEGARYSGPNTDRVFYDTPENAGLRFAIGAHEEKGMVRVFMHPDDVDAVEEALKAL